MVIIRTPISDYCPRNHQTVGDAFIQQCYSISHYLPPRSHELNEDVHAFVKEYYQILCDSPARVAEFYDDDSVLCRYENDGSKSVTTTLMGIYNKILSLKYDEFVDITIISLGVGMYINSEVPVLVKGFLTRKDNKTQGFFHSFLLAPLERRFFVLRDTSIYVTDEYLHVNFLHSEDEIKLCASEVDDIYFSVRTLQYLEKVDKLLRQLAEGSANGEVSVVKEEDPPVAEVLDQVQDNPHMVVQSAGKIEEIVSASTSLSSGNEFQEDWRSLVNCRRRKVTKKMESHGPANAELQQLDHGIAEVVDEVQDDSHMVVQSVVKIEKVLKKASASIDRGRPSASSTSHSSRSEFQEGESSHVDPHRNKVPKTMESQSPTNAGLEQLVRAIADEYIKLRQTAEEHRDKSEYYKNKANTAHSKGKLGEAADLSKQASSEAEKARKVQTEALWASQVIFTARSMIRNNTLTIDLHYQSVDHAMWYLKRYLKLMSSIHCVLILKVITGQGLNSKDGVPKIKPAVIIFLDKEEIEWEEEKGNPGALLIKLDGKREFKFGPG